MPLAIDRYWPFAVFCGLLLLVVVRMLLRERIALQGSISFVSVLLLFLLVTLFPGPTARLARWMGFEVLSNFLFCLALIALAILHLRALVTLSRLETRTVHLTQDLGLLEEKLKRPTRSE